MNDNNRRFYFKELYYDVIGELDQQNRLQLYDSIFEYVFDGTERDDLPGLLKSIFILIKASIDEEFELGDD